MEDPILLDLPDSFETDRLLIRSPLPGDGPELHAAVRESLVELEPWMDWTHHHGTPEGSEASVRQARIEYLKRRELRMHLYLKGTETLVGSSGLHRIDWSVPKVEIGYWLRTGYTGRGYATEAVRKITAFALDTLGAKRVEIRCHPKNAASLHVAERCAFSLEGRLRNEARLPNGTLHDSLVLTRLPQEPDARSG